MTKKFAESAYNGGITSLQHLHNVMIAMAADCKPVVAGAENLFGETITDESAADQNARMLTKLAASVQDWAEYLGD